MSATQHRHIARRSRPGVILAVSGATSLIAATVLTIGPSSAHAEPDGRIAGEALPSTASVEVLTPRVEPGGTARIVVGVVSDGTRPGGRVQLKVGDQVLTRDLAVGTASASVRLHEPGEVRVRARHLGGDLETAPWSDAVTIAVG